MKEKVEKIGRVTSASVLKCTGKNWDHWIRILDTQGARGWTHQEIVKFLKTKHKLRPWWQQGVTTGYEIHIGRRVMGQNQKGEYSTTATKNIAFNHKVVWKFLMSQNGLKIWLNPMSEFKIKVGNQYEVYGGIFGEIRTIKAGQQLRMTWQESDWEKPTIVYLLVIGRVKTKTMIVISHENLKTEDYKLKMRAHWKGVLSEVNRALTESS